MEDELMLDSILNTDEISDLFNTETPEDSEQPENKKEQKETEDTEEIQNPTEIPIDELFDEESESVSTEDKDSQEDGEKAKSKKSKQTSSNNFYSSIAYALKEDGILPDLDDQTEINNPEDFAQVIEKHIKAQFDERQQRIDDALNAGIETSEIKKYENALNYLDSIDDSIISDETDKGENLRKQLIYQDFINRGYSQERAKREVTKSFNAGTDIEDAKESLTSNKEFFKEEYDSIINEAKEEEALAIKERREQAEKLKKSILNDEKVFGNLSVNKETRQKVFNAISKPVFKDPKNGVLYTELQKYEMENRTEFLKNVGLIYTLTNGFKNLDNLVKSEVNKKVKKGLRELENTINSTSRTSDGNLKFVSGVDDDPESYHSKWNFDL